jgi:2-C-methyl-D-erythritol 4-phosphate cytidylyltransferase
MGQGMNKVFIPLNNRPLLSYTIDVFEKCEAINEVIIVVGAEDTKRLQSLIADYRYQKVREIVAGGAERQHSIANALKRLSPATRWVVVHDGARPFVSSDLVARAVADARKWGAIGVAVPVKDTVKIVDEDGFVLHTPDRKKIWAMQTPQVFARDILEKAYQYGGESGTLATDDAALVEALGIKVKLLLGDYLNIKITTPEDLLFAEAILGRNGLCE